MLKRIKRVRMILASSKMIQEMSYGEVTEIDTFNHRTLKPVEGGLFCQAIFGPVVSYECACERYKGIKYEDVICEKCKVQVTSSLVRRARMGHINLPVPVYHPWFGRSIGNKIATLLDMNTKCLKSVFNLHRYIVIKPGKTQFNIKDVISEETYFENSNVEGFEAGTGPEAIEQLLMEISFDEEIAKHQALFNESKSLIAKKKHRNMLIMLKSMSASCTRPEYLMLRTIPVIAADLRPLVELEVGKFVSSDLNTLYQTVIYRAKRLKSLINNQIVIPLIYHNEIRMLQEAVNNLFGAGKEGK